jgi:hypothetical protein
MKVNDWLLSQFPPLSLTDRFLGVILRNFEPAFMRLRDHIKDNGKRVRKLLGDMGLRTLKRKLLGGSS